MKSYQHLYLSPHIDDVSLSCGGTIHQQRQAGESVITVTVCTAQPATQTFSAYVDWMHGIWGNLGEVVATRLAEDRASMAILGCDADYLPFSDCIYRGDPQAGEWYYTRDEELFGAIHPGDLPLANEIAEAVAALISTQAETCIYAPLAVGHHVDHQLVHRAARRLRTQGYQVVFYEDYPYADPKYPYSKHSAENEFPLTAALAASEDLRLTPRLQSLSEEDVRTKVESIRAYGSQMEMLFGGDALVANYVRDYVIRVGQGVPAERFWAAGR